MEDRGELTGNEREAAGMNWMLIVIIVSVASGDRALSTMTIPTESQKVAKRGIS